MSGAIFYRSTNPTLLQAFRDYVAEGLALYMEAQVFARSFGVDVEACFYQSLGRRHFAGLRKFSDALDTQLWRKRSSASPYQTPRSSVVSKHLKAQLQTLHERWAQRPKQAVSLGPVLALLGMNEGNLLFSPFAIFEWDGAIWVETDQSKALELPDTAEVLGSVFVGAVRTHAEKEKES